MNSRGNTDENLIEEIRKGGAARLRALETIFKDQNKRSRIIRYLKSKGCHSQDAEDLYQDAVIIFDKKVKSGDYLSLSNIDNYIFSIVKMSWLNRYRQNKRRAEDSIHEDLSLEESVSSYYARQERAHMMKKILSLFGERCLKLLHMFSQGYRIDEMVEPLQMVDAERVRKEKYRCLNRMRVSVQRNPEFGQYIKNQLRPDEHEI